jgi:hypothetical protein
LENKSWFWKWYSPKEQNTVLNRLKGTQRLLSLIERVIQDHYTDAEMKSVIVNGSFVYNPEWIMPNDIDITVVIDNPHDVFDVHPKMQLDATIVTFHGNPITSLDLSVIGEGIFHDYASLENQSFYFQERDISLTKRHAFLVLYTGLYGRAIPILGRDFCWVKPPVRNLLNGAYSETNRAAQWLRSGQKSHYIKSLRFLLEANYTLTLLDPDINFSQEKYWRTAREFMYTHNEERLLQKVLWGTYPSLLDETQERILNVIQKYNHYLERE